jgi:hypothetical protein
MAFTSSIGPRWFRYSHRWGGARRRHGRFGSWLYWLTGLALLEISGWAVFYVVQAMLVVTVFTARLIGGTVTVLANSWADRSAERKAHRDAT